MSARRSSSSAGSSAAASSSAAAASAASAALPPARGRSTHSSGAAAASTSSNSHATAANHAAPLSAATTLSGHKRTAAAAAGSSSSAAASASSAAATSDQPASSASQTKKQRGESSSKQRNGLSAAAAASSAGLDPLPTPPRRPAASSAAASDASSSAAAQPSSHRIQHAGDKTSAGRPAAASAAASLAPPADVPHRLLSDAKELLSGGLPLAESKALRSNGRNERMVADARACIQETASVKTMVLLGRLCLRLLWDSCYLELPSEQTALRGWILRTDALFTQLVTELPQMKLGWKDCDELIGSAVFVGALQAVPALVRRRGGMPSYRMAGNPLLTYYCITPQEHVVSLQPYLRLFDFGLDPTEVKADGDPLSALQLSRDFVRTHPVPARRVALPADQQFLRLAFAILGVNAGLDDEDGGREAQTLRDGAVATMEAAVAKAEPQAIPSVLFARAIQQRESAEPIEMQRRAVLHAQFMHALVPAWLSHSTKVRALLLKAAPGRLIPPLVDIVSRYLDLEGVSPERSAPVYDAAEMA